MHTSPPASASRTYTPSPLDEVPPDIFSLIVVNHISLREGRAMTSLACVSRVFAQRMKPHMAPLRLYRMLENASQGLRATALHGCMETLYELAQINPAHRLELFLRVTATLHHHFSGTAITPHIDILLASLQHLDRDEQPAALLNLLANYWTSLFCTTKQQFVDMARRVGALQPCAAQCELAIILEPEISGESGPEFPERVQAFLSMCMRLRSVYSTKAIRHTLWRIGVCRRDQAYPGLFGGPADDKQMAHNKHALLWGLHECLQSMPMQQLPVEEQVLLLGKALVMPVLLDDVEEGDRMAISLLRMIPPEHGDFYWKRNEEYGDVFGDLVESMLKQVFERGPRHSIHRFQCLYQAMAHLPPKSQIYWMRDILLNCARKAEAGLTPALIVATAQAALQLSQAQPELKLLYDLFALGLNPAPLRKAGSYPLVKPAEVDSAEQPGYVQRFDAKCSELIHLLANVAPDMAGKLLAGMNGAYQEYRPLGDMLPPGSLFRTELYGRFLKQALAFLRSLPPADSAASLLQWKLPGLHITDARHADDWVCSLMTAAADVSRDNDRVSVEQQKTALGDLLQNGIDVPHHSPARNQRLLAGLAAFPDAVGAHVLVRLLEYQYMSFAHYDVLFASTVEAARRLPDGLRSSVLEAAVSGLTHFPDPQTMGITRSTLQQERNERLERDYPGLQESYPDLYALMQPGCVSRMDGWALLLDAVETLPVQHRADRLKQLCGSTIFFRFSNNRLSDQEKAQCSMRLLSAVMGLPSDSRGKAFSSWLKHVYRQSYQPEQRQAIQAALLPLLLALPASEGRPLLNAYLSSVWPAEERSALEQRAAAHWKDAV
ncbi:hypothetical protein [Noviherbaspirillum soli]|uniref:hypothetical protein n=1 Tax=Noviherbaspirillum soli TaxID=1064518 RepID=UPI00188AEE32|nr:hypothetical protein [Noviherbaspirillum soli]